MAKAQEKESDAARFARESLEKNNKKKTEGFPKYDTTIHFTTILPANVDSATKKIRILPGENGQWFQEIQLHKMHIGKQWNKFLCLEGNFGEECPFCEAEQQYMTRNKKDGLTPKEDFVLACKYKPFPAYVCKVIDRDAEDEGVKFWRFSHDFSNKGIMDKLTAIMDEKGDITHPRTGRDLSIKIVRDQNKNPIINSIIQDDPSLLTDNKEKAVLWIGDKRTWQDVYKKYAYEYLEIVVKTGQIPIWDKTVGEGGGYRARTTDERFPETPIPEKGKDAENKDDIPF